WNVAYGKSATMAATTIGKKLFAHNDNARASSAKASNGAASAGCCCGSMPSGIAAVDVGSIGSSLSASTVREARLFERFDVGTGREPREHRRVRALQCIRVDVKQ